MAAVKACKDNNDAYCIPLIRDVIFMMGWTNNMSEEYLFFKIQSIGVKYMHYLRKAFPNVPWIFVFRDPVEVMMSHLKGSNISHAVCLRTQRSKPKDTMKLAAEIVKSNNPKLSKVEFCAAHLATLCNIAFNEYKNS